MTQSNSLFEWSSAAVICLFGILLSLALAVRPAGAESISDVQPVVFGTIIADPAGDVIEIDAAAGPAVPQVFGSGRSRVTGGNSGLIQIYSDVVGQTFTIDYPISISLSGGGSSLTMDGIQARSKDYAVSTEIGTIDFPIGGLLNISSGQPGATYDGTMTVTITVNNP